MKEVAIDLLSALDWLVLFYFLVLNTSYLMLVLAAARQAGHSLRRGPTSNYDDIFANPATPAVSVVMAAYNEEACVVESVRAALGLRYPEFEVIVVDDGSSDRTFERLSAEFDLAEVAPAADPGVRTLGAMRSMHASTTDDPLVVVRKVNVQKRSDAINAGLNVAQYPLVCCVDADSILEADALLRVVKPFVDDPDRVIATGGSIRAINGSPVYRGQIGEPQLPRGWLARIQVLEYLRSFLLGRSGWSGFGGLLIISGAFGLYRRDALIDIGGFDTDSLAEDADATIALHRRAIERGDDYRIVFVPDSVCWTEVPSSRADLARQRRRWSHGLFQVMSKHRRVIGNPRYGRVGIVAMPYYLLFELLGAVVELVGVAAVILGLALGVVSIDFAILFAVVAIGFGIAVSLSALLVEEVIYHKYRSWPDLLRSVAACLLENLGYRQLHAWWRLQGLADAFGNREPEWGEIHRAGFAAEQPAPQPPR